MKNLHVLGTKGSQKDIAGVFASGALSDKQYEELLAGAIDAGRLNAVKWIFRQSPLKKWSPVRAFEMAIVSGKLNIVRWIFERETIPIDNDIFTLVGRHGRVDIFTYLSSQICKRPREVAYWPDSVRRINMNAYPEGDDGHDEDEDEFCECVGVCGEECYNRGMQLYCHDDNCHQGPNCGNRFASHENMITLFDTRSLKGIGAKANQDIPAGILIVEYVGEIIDIDQVKTRNYPFYTMHLEGDLYIDAARVGNNSRFFNHRCQDQNCEIQKWGGGARTRIGIFSKRGIAMGEELFIRYSGELPFICECGAERCVSKIKKQSTANKQ